MEHAEEEGMMVRSWKLGYNDAAFQTWPGVMAPEDITPAQIAYWEDVLRRVTESEEFRKVGERN